MDGREEFERLYADHAGTVRRYAMRRAEPGEADDVVAEVFLAAWRRFDQVPNDPLPWLLWLARGAMSNRRRSRQREWRLIGRLAAERPSGGSQPDAAEPLDEELVGALSTLTADDQELLLLVAWEQLDRAEIATVLGVRPGTVAVRLHRARRRLRQALAGQRRPISSHADHSPEPEGL